MYCNLFFVQSVTGDILGNFGVRISDPWGKKALKILFEILFWLETSGNDHLRGRGRGCKCPCPQINVPFYFPKTPFYSQNCPFIFQNSLFNIPELHYYFPEVSFCSCSCCFVFQKCFFISQKCPIVFQNFPLVFVKWLLFIYCAGYFPRVLFFQLIVPSPSPAQRDNICLALLLFPLATVYWPTSDALHLACVQH